MKTLNTTRFVNATTDDLGLWAPVNNLWDMEDNLIANAEANGTWLLPAAVRQTRDQDKLIP